MMQTTSAVGSYQHHQYACEIQHWLWIPKRIERIDITMSCECPGGNNNNSSSKQSFIASHFSLRFIRWHYIFFSILSLFIFCVFSNIAFSVRFHCHGSIRRVSVWLNDIACYRSNACTCTCYTNEHCQYCLRDVGVQQIGIPQTMAKTCYLFSLHIDANETDNHCHICIQIYPKCNACIHPLSVYISVGFCFACSVINKRIYTIHVEFSCHANIHSGAHHSQCNANETWGEKKANKKKTPASNNKQMIKFNCTPLIYNLVHAASREAHNNCASIESCCS